MTIFAGIVSAQPEVAAIGLAVTATGGVEGLAAGGVQIVGGVLQGIGGAGYSNAINGTVTLGASALIGRSVAGPSSTGYRSASQRASDQFFKDASTVSGGIFDTVTSFIDQLGPQKKTCSRP